MSSAAQCQLDPALLMDAWESGWMGRRKSRTRHSGTSQHPWSSFFGPAAAEVARSPPGRGPAREEPLGHLLAASCCQTLGKPHPPRHPYISATFEHRRHEWRARLEAALARAAARAERPGEPEGAQPLPHPLRFPHGITFSLPVSPATSRGGSPGSTPAVSPKPTPTPGEAAWWSPSAHAHDVPPIWRGCAAAEAPADFDALSDGDLERFLHQAGCSAAAGGGRAALVAAAQAARPAWEVERIAAACTLPEEVLRLKPHEHTGPDALRAAWKRVAMRVHPVSTGPEMRLVTSVRAQGAVAVAGRAALAGGDAGRAALEACSVRCLNNARWFQPSGAGPMQCGRCCGRHGHRA
jgi:hypothetical protein